jgi:hypothetical protein
MAWVAEELFDSYADGNLAGNNGGTGWASAWEETYLPNNLQVQGTVKYQGAKGVSCTNAAGTASRRQLAADVSGAFVVYVGVRAHQTNGGGGTLNLRSAAGGRAYVQFDVVDGQGTVGDISINGTDTKKVVTYTANTFYVIRLTGNTTTGKFTAAYSTDAYGTAGTFSGESAECTMYSTGDLRYCTINPGAGYDFDYISPTSPFSTTAAPTVTTQDPTDITETTATGNGNVTSDGGATVTERGICIGASANPTTSGTKFTASGTTGAFTAAITGLSTATHYHVRAYAINSVGTSYGADVEFDSASAPPWRFENLNGIVFHNDDKKTIFAERLNEILDRLAALDGLEPDPDL